MTITVLLFEAGEVKTSARGAKPGAVLEQELGLTDRSRATAGDSHECAC